jgi:hypothetical protein
MIDPITVVHPSVGMSISEMVALLRDIGFFGGVLYFGWRARGWAQPGIDFFKRAASFMDATQASLKSLQVDMHALMVNHIPHIEVSLGIKYPVPVIESSEFVDSAAVSAEEPPVEDQEK